jgi:hypothetical protein
LRRGGFDRIAVPEPWSPTIDELTGSGTNGLVYAHELVELPPGGARPFLDVLATTGRFEMEASGLECVAALRVAMGSGTEAIVIWAIPDLSVWAAFEQAWDNGTLATWRADLDRLGARVRRPLLVAAPLSPMRTGRQPDESDRLPLSEI